MSANGADRANATALTLTRARRERGPEAQQPGPGCPEVWRVGMQACSEGIHG